MLCPFNLCCLFAALKHLQNSGATYFVLDLRDNLGGLVQVCHPPTPFLPKHISFYACFWSPRLAWHSWEIIFLSSMVKSLALSKIWVYTSTIQIRVSSTRIHVSISSYLQFHLVPPRFIGLIVSICSWITSFSKQFDVLCLWIMKETSKT